MEEERREEFRVGNPKVSAGRNVARLPPALALALDGVLALGAAFLEGVFFGVLSPFMPVAVPRSSGDHRSDAAARRDDRRTDWPAELVTIRVPEAEERRRPRGVEDESKCWYSAYETCREGRATGVVVGWVENEMGNDGEDGVGPGLSRRPKAVRAPHCAAVGLIAAKRRNSSI